MRSVGLIWASVVLAVCLPSKASAYEEQATVGLEVGYAGLSRTDFLPRNGVDVGATAGFGITDAWGIQGILSYNIFPDQQPLHMGIAGLETVYALDIVRFVPLFGAGLDGVLSVRERTTRGDFALHLLVGVDYLINRRWLVGADVRFYWVATNANSFLDPFILVAAARVGIRFDTR